MWIEMLVTMIVGAGLLALGFWAGTKSTNSTSLMTLRLNSELQARLDQAETALQARTTIEALMEKATDSTRHSAAEAMAAISMHSEKVEDLSEGFEKLDSTIGQMLGLMQKAGLLTPKPEPQVGEGWGKGRPGPPREEPPPRQRSVPSVLGTPT